MSEKALVPPGKVQEILVKKFTAVEVKYLSIWFYFSAIGLVTIVIGLYDLLLVNRLLDGIALLVGGLAVSAGSAEVLDYGLHKEHDLAVEAGNAGPDA